MKLLVSRRARGAPGDAFLRKLGDKTLRLVRGAVFSRRAEVSLLFCGDGAMRRLNRRWRRLDRSTDVLSFPLLERFPPARDTGQPLCLGDVVISVSTARRQARAAGSSSRAEMGLLWVHGLLHLLGYDHARKSDEKRMFVLQAKILGMDA